MRIRQIVIYALATVMLQCSLLCPGNAASESNPAIVPFGFDMTAEELNQKGKEMYRIVLAWDETGIPQSFDDFPIIPSHLAETAKAVEETSASLLVTGRTATWISNAEDIYDGNYGEIIDDACYGWTSSGEDIYFKKVKDDTYESLPLLDASETNYVRQERKWKNGDDQYTFGADFFEADEEHGNRLTSIEMRDESTGMEMIWQINSERPDIMMIDVKLYSDGQFYSFEYNLNTKELMDYSCME